MARLASPLLDWCGRCGERLGHPDCIGPPIERMLRSGVETYTRPGKPKGCMVVSAATNCSSTNDAVLTWLATHRRGRTASIIERLRQAVNMGELPADTDVEALGDYFAAFLHGLSVQARDGIPKKRLLASIPVAVRLLDSGQ